MPYETLTTMPSETTRTSERRPLIEPNLYLDFQGLAERLAAQLRMLVETNDDGEVARWETHVNDEYSAFLDVAIGVHGPFHGTSEYVEALERCLAAAGISV